MPSYTKGCRSSEGAFAVETEETKEREETQWCQGGRGCELTSSLEQAVGRHQRKISPGVGRDLSNTVRGILLRLEQ